jgi:hypothetical protein
MKILLVLVFLFLPAAALAAINCSVGPLENGVGDQISGSITLHIRDTSSYAWDVYDREGNVVTWMPGSISSSSDPSFNWTIAAAGVSEIISAVQLSGRTSDNCDISISSIVPVRNPDLFVLTDGSKQAYHNIGNMLVGLGTGAALVAQFPCNVGDGLSCGILTTTSILSNLAGGLLLQVDPWDDAYGSPYEAVYPTAAKLGLSYMGGDYGNAFWNTITADNDVMVSTAINVSANLNAANISVNRAMSCHQIGDSCDQWQAERAREFFENANQNVYWLAAAMWELANQYKQQRFGQDYINVWDAAAGQFWQMYNNGVR